ncbi:hypothetical protein WJX81_001580 [Elliptochloris bilobata]|uniref:DEK-C domain-containing protein n=1 Tax=Elliptochloris bilobata TaxID=381761 RepID=A0AAW1RXK9_9CHLO
MRKDTGRRSWLDTVGYSQGWLGRQEDASNYGVQQLKGGNLVTGLTYDELIDARQATLAALRAFAGKLKAAAPKAGGQPHGGAAEPSQEAWECVQLLTDGEGQQRACGYVNRFTPHECAACGAARWDGPDGQLRARLAAVLQTADLSATTMRQVMRRLEAEGGGLQAALPKETVKAEIDAGLLAMAERPGDFAGAAASEWGGANNEAEAWSVSVDEELATDFASLGSDTEESLLGDALRRKQRLAGRTGGGAGGNLLFGLSAPLSPDSGAPLITGRRGPALPLPADAARVRARVRPLPPATRAALQQAPLDQDLADTWLVALPLQKLRMDLAASGAHAAPAGAPKPRAGALLPAARVLVRFAGVAGEWDSGARRARMDTGPLAGVWATRSDLRAAHGASWDAARVLTDSGEPGLRIREWEVQRPCLLRLGAPDVLYSKAERLSELYAHSA